MKPFIKEIVEWVVVAAVLLVPVWVVFSTGTTIAMVRTESMFPTIHPGDVVIATPGPVQVDDIVVFEPQVAGVELPKFVHRVVGVKKDGSWVTQGDAHENPDAAHVGNDNVHGVVRYTLPTRFLTSTWSIAIGGALIGGALMWSFIGKQFKNEDDELPADTVETSLEEK